MRLQHAHLSPSRLACVPSTTCAHVPEQCCVTCLLCSGLSLLRFFNTHWRRCQAASSPHIRRWLRTFNMRLSQPLPACVHSLHHLRTHPRTVLRNLPSVQWFVSAQVLQPALTDSCATPSPAHSGTHTHNPKPQQKPTPSSSSPFIGQYYVTSSCYYLPFRVHFLCRCTRSSQSSTSPSPFRTLPQVPSSLSRCPHLSVPYSLKDRKL